MGDRQAGNVLTAYRHSHGNVMNVKTNAEVEHAFRVNLGWDFSATTVGT